MMTFAGAILLLPMLVTDSAVAQIRYLRGQNVAPVFEGWQKNDDGTFTFFFGYMNRNHEELVDLAIGQDNFFAPGPEDRDNQHTSSRDASGSFSVSPCRRIGGLRIGSPGP